MFDDVYLSIALLTGCSFLLGFCIGAWYVERREQKRDEAYYRECERDFYRAESRAPDGEPF
jgi:hypothetical protein